MPNTLKRVRIATRHAIVEIPWASRDALLRELRPLPSTAGIIQAFEAVGASRPATPSARQRDQLYTLIDEWGRRVQADNLPEGIWSLRSALAYD